jgi:hypothetical protein
MEKYSATGCQAMVDCRPLAALWTSTLVEVDTNLLDLGG